MTRSHHRVLNRQEAPRPAGSDPMIYSFDVATADNTALTNQAAAGDQAAWNEIVRRFESLVWSVTYGFRLPQAAREDVFQLTWLRLLDNIERIDTPERLAGWLATTARRECLAIVRSTARVTPVEDFDDLFVEDSSDTRLLSDERLQAVHRGIRELGERCQLLLGLLAHDPPVEYVDIAEILGIALGSVGPTRQRCIDRLRSRPSVAKLIAVDEPRKQDEK